MLLCLVSTKSEGNTGKQSQQFYCNEPGILVVSRLLEVGGVEVKSVCLSGVTVSSRTLSDN